MHLNKLLKEIVDQQASDLHLKVDSPPIARIHRSLIKLKYPVLTVKDIEGFAKELLPPGKQDLFIQRKEIDFAYSVAGISRFRVNIFYQRGVPGIVIRRVKTEFSDFKSLGLPEILKTICEMKQGIVLVCGPASSGKSTTIATMIEYINTHRKLHIITIEDPIEFLFEDKECMINQREVSIDTESFPNALKYIMREDPDLIYIGELRDPESFQTALKAAETGHLVFSTMHAGNVRDTVDRVLDYFPQEQRGPILSQLANTLSAVISMKLIPRKDGKGMVPALEIMVSNGVTRKLIRDNTLSKLPAAIEMGKQEGMQTFNLSLMELVQSDKITQEEALARSFSPEVLKLNLQGIFLDDASKILEG